jgi:hypothetical protein
MGPQEHYASSHPQAETGWPVPTERYDSAGSSRVRGVRQARHAANWTAAALLAAVAAATGYFAHHPAASAPSLSTGGTSATTAHGGHVSVAHPIVTSGGSGVVAGTGPGGSAGSTRSWSDN